MGVRIFVRANATNGHTINQPATEWKSAPTIFPGEDQIKDLIFSTLKGKAELPVSISPTLIKGTNMASVKGAATRFASTTSVMFNLVLKSMAASTHRPVLAPVLVPRSRRSATSSSPCVSFAAVLFTYARTEDREESDAESHGERVGHTTHVCAFLQRAQDGTHKLGVQAALRTSPRRIHVSFQAFAGSPSTFQDHVCARNAAMALDFVRACLASSSCASVGSKRDRRSWLNSIVNTSSIPIEGDVVGVHHVGGTRARATSTSTSTHAHAHASRERKGTRLCCGMPSFAYVRAWGASPTCEAIGRWRHLETTRLRHAWTGSCLAPSFRMSVMPF